MVTNIEKIYTTGLQTRLIAPITSGAVTCAVEDDLTQWAPSWVTGKAFYMTLVDPSANREIVKVTGISRNTLTITRGQDGSTARAWETGTLMEQRLVAADAGSFIQEGSYREFGYNPNGVLTAVYPGEKAYEDYGQRWWKNISGTKWQCIAGMLDDKYRIATNYNNKIFRSTDWGVTWGEIEPAGITNKPWLQVAMSANGKYMTMVCYEARMYTSADYGATWTERQPAGAVNYDWRGAICDYTGQHVLVGGGKAGNGKLYVSEDYGVNWAAATQPRALQDGNWTRFGSNYDGSLWIVCEDDYLSPAGVGRVYISDDFGVTWTEIQPKGDTDQYWSFAASNVSGQYLIVGSRYGGRLNLSDDYGSTWNEIQPDGDHDRYWAYAGISVDGQYMCVCSELNTGGIFTSDDYGVSWTERLPGGLYGYWHWIASSQGGDYIVVGGKRIYVSQNYGINWTEVQPQGDVNGAWNVSMNRG